MANPAPNGAAQGAVIVDGASENKQTKKFSRGATSYGFLTGEKQSGWQTLGLV
jgi:hypothetical protein